MRLEYFQMHRLCFYLATCSCGKIREAPGQPFAATRFAANHARRNPGHTSYVFDMEHLNTVSIHHHVPLPAGDAPPF